MNATLEKYRMMGQKKKGKIQLWLPPSITDKAKESSMKLITGDSFSVLSHIIIPLDGTWYNMDI